MKSILIVGIGRFGKHLAINFTDLGNEVMVVDQDEPAVAGLAPLVTATRIGDCKDEEVVRALGVNNFDLCFVCIAGDFQSSLEVTSLLKEHGARYVVAKAERDVHAKFLLRNGADEVIYPERDMARKVSRRFSVRHAFDFIELSPEYAVFEVAVPDAWVGKTPRELAVRTRYGFSIIAVRLDGRLSPLVNAEHVFREGERMVVTGSQKEVICILDRL